MSWEKSELNVMSCLFVLGYEISTYKDKHLMKMGKKKKKNWWHDSDVDFFMKMKKWSFKH
jgi:hypothetical protein